jgi:large subunit ribosomal protein L2
MPLKNIPLGIMVHNVELYPGHGGQMARGAGTGVTVIAKEGATVHLKLASGEVRVFSPDCYATIGRVGNVGHKDEEIGSAGRKRLMGIRPTVRGVAQDPRSHPHGGGEQKSGEGMPSKTPWGKPARGKKTRNRKKWSNKFIIKKRK